MYRTQKTYITNDKKMLDLINENYSLLLCLQHFDIDFSVDNKTVKELCSENKISLSAFIIIANLYSGFFPTENEIDKIDDISPILSFLKKSHSFYINDKYPELKHECSLKRYQAKLEIYPTRQTIHSTYLQQAV